MKVTVDAGNSRIKARAWSGAVDAAGVPRPVGGLVTGGELPQILSAVDRWLRGLEEPFEAALISVGPSAARAELERLLRERAARLVQRPDPGLEVRCSVPERVGVDRLWAARGAVARAGRSAVVLDAGTALTVDAVVCDGEGGDAFLGGAIAPGPELGARALATWAARLPLVQPRPGVAALGRDTEEAILAGVGIGFRGSAAVLARAVAEEAGLLDAPLFLTGGARGFLAGSGDFHGPVEECEDLVHLGLLDRAFGPPTP
ncbi:MAG TPA: type III pantothenate kinase [Planctomycetes bacterium]|nr:type III pantothenate kinase [Planctomycetota bacterium]